MSDNILNTYKQLIEFIEYTQSMNDPMPLDIVLHNQIIKRENNIKYLESDQKINEYVDHTLTIKQYKLEIKILRNIQEDYKNV